MIISTKLGTPKEELEKLVGSFEGQGIRVSVITGTDYTVIGLVGDTTRLDEKRIRANPYVDNVQRVSEPYKLANRLFHHEDSVISVRGIPVGGKEKLVVIGGPCSVEGKEQIVEVAKSVKAAGGHMLRGGAYKPVLPLTPSRAWVPRHPGPGGSPQGHRLAHCQRTDERG